MTTGWAMRAAAPVEGLSSWAAVCRKMKWSQWVWLAALACCVTGPVHGHGAYHDVVEELTLKLQENPNDAALRFKLAETHVGHDEWRACLAELKLVERLAPGQFAIAYLRGLALHIAGSEEAAKQELDAFLVENPNHGDALATRGRVLMNLQRPVEAAKDFQKAFDLATSPSRDLILNLATAYEQSGESRRASSVIDKGLETNGDSPSLLEYALAIESAREDWDAALRRIDALQKTGPGPSSWMAQRAQMLVKAGRPAEARAAWAVLRDHLISLPTLERGYPQNVDLLKQARSALGESSLAPVAAAPLSPKK